MPPTGRRTRSRREANLQEQSDADTLESMQTPTRKRRRVNPGEGRSTAATRRRRTASAQSADTLDAPEDEDDDDNGMDPNHRLEYLVVSKLRTAQYIPNVTRDWSNAVIEQQQPGMRAAFAKIAGHNWTYFVTKDEINIGRADRPTYEPAEPANGVGNGTAPYDGPTANVEIDVDLGPERSVSRLHALIYYESDSFGWFVHVNGRNGLKLDDTHHGRGAKVPLHSGIVLSICGTQMLFVLPDAQLTVHPMIREQAGLKSEDDDADLDPRFHLPPGRAGKDGRGPPPPGNGVRDFGAPEGFGRSPAQHGSGRGRAHAAAAASSSQAVPGTPAAGRGEFLAKPTHSPAYARGMKMESTEQIDYSLEGNKDVKPPYSYAQIIGQAIMGAPDEQISLNDIYEFMRKNYAFYRFSNEKWPNSIRHNLSLNKAFEKVPRKFDDPGKGNKWTLVSEHREEFLRKGLTNARRAPRKVESGPNSPATRTGPASSAAATVVSPIRSHPHANAQHPFDGAQIITTPPASYPIPHESFTPDRGPRPGQLRATQGLADSLGIINGASSQQTRLEEHTTPDRTPRGFQPHLAAAQDTPGGSLLNRGSSFEHPTPIRTKPDPAHAFSLSPPAGAPTPSAHHSNAAATLFNPAHNHHHLGAGGAPTDPSGAVVTPFISRQHPRLAPPSVAVPPSQFMQLSSPAPFWKYADLGSTPARGGGHGSGSGGGGGAQWSEGSDLDADGDLGSAGPTNPAAPKTSDDDEMEEAAATDSGPLESPLAPPQPSSPPALPPPAHSAAIAPRDDPEDADPDQRPTDALRSSSDDRVPTTTDDVFRPASRAATRTPAELPSPSRTISRPASRRDASPLKPAGGDAARVHLPSQPSQLQGQGQAQVSATASTAPPRALMGMSGAGGGAAAGGGLAAGVGVGAGLAGVGDDEGEEQGIDLAKGFQAIGTFHRNLTRGAGITGA